MDADTLHSQGGSWAGPGSHAEAVRIGFDSSPLELARFGSSADLMEDSGERGLALQPADQRRVWRSPTGRLLLALTLIGPSPLKTFSAEPLVRVEMAEGSFVGLPLTWSANYGLLLEPDGRIREVEPAAALQVEQLDQGFRPSSAVDVRAALQREFGDRHAISTTPYYVVVHPHGREQWAEEFDRLHRTFLRFFETRGYPLRQGRFVMVAIVMPNRQSFERYAHQEGIAIAPQVVGYYSKRTNRIVMYDDLGAALMPTIRHEAAHQSAYNTGLHDRVYPMPTWVVEGLGGVFEVEAPGHQEPSDMRSYLRTTMRETAQAKDLVAELVESDQLFAEEPALAYSLSWRLTDHLLRTRSMHYVRYLQQLSDPGVALQRSAVHRRALFETHLQVRIPELARELENGLANP